MRIPTCRSIAFGIVIGCLLLSVGQASGASPLNVLLITADDLGVQLGCYGDRAARTPQLDALAARGCLFENAYVAQASCSPSRSAMFTGLYPHSNGQYGLLNANVGFEIHEDLRSKTIPAILKRQGFATAIMGKLHVGPEKSFPFDQRLRADTRDVHAAAKTAGEFLQSVKAPFFLMANYADPHVMGRSPRPPQEAFPTQYKGIPQNPLKIGQVPSFPFQEVKHPEQIERTTQYYNAATRFDTAVGLLLAELTKSGHAADTLILFVGDHGPPFFRGKTSCYEGGVKVPMLVVWPNVISPGSRSKALVSTVDILPTILDATDCPEQIATQGMSLRTAGLADDFRPFLATEFHYHGNKPFFPRRTIRDARYKLIHNLRAGQATPINSIDGDAALRLAMEPDGDTPDEVRQAFQVAANPPEFELYDLQTDPWEFHNLAEQPEYQPQMHRMKDALLTWRKETNDPLLTDEGFKAIAAYENKTPDPPRR
ncbi:MAG: sulfatase [Planctomycetaceae bacterium]|nr:sulfatase [Planctomycetaceae bacterium]